MVGALVFYFRDDRLGLVLTEGEQNHFEEQVHSEVAFAVGKLFAVECCPKAGQWSCHPGPRNTLEM